jgi:hypothetical protein
MQCSSTAAHTPWLQIASCSGAHCLAPTRRLSAGPSPSTEGPGLSSAYFRRRLLLAAWNAPGFRCTCRIPPATRTPIGSAIPWWRGCAPNISTLPPGERSPTQLRSWEQTQPAQLKAGSLPVVIRFPRLSLSEACSTSGIVFREKECGWRPNCFDLTRLELEFPALAPAHDADHRGSRRT